MAQLPAPDPEGARVNAARLPRRLWEAMAEHALDEAPIEACGILAGLHGKPVRFFPTRNAEQSTVRYSIAPEELIKVMNQIDQAGLTLWGIFHSHPATEAYPSHVDVRLAFYPEAYYLIASLREAEPVLRAFRIVSGQVAEVPVVFEEEPREGTGL